MNVLVIGQSGEVGSAIYELAKGVHTVEGIDIKGSTLPQVGDYKGPWDVMHVTIPYGRDFVHFVQAYIEIHDPKLVIVESTVMPGTTRALDELTGRRIVHSPVRGLHHQMKRDLLRFVKYVGSYDKAQADKAIEYYKTLGIEAQALHCPLETEYAKLFDLVFYANLIALHQTFWKICMKRDVRYWEACIRQAETGRLGFEYKWPKPIVFPDVIGGHCVIPGLEMLHQSDPDAFFDEMLRRSKEFEEYAKSDKWHRTDILAMKEYIAETVADW